MPQGTLSLHHVIEQVSQEKGIDPKVLVEATEQAILTAAKRTFGVDRELEARFNVESGSVDLFQYMTVVQDVDNPDNEVSLEDASRYGLEAEEGEELGFQIFYMAGDSERARQQDKEFGELLGIQQARNGFGRIAAQTAKQVIIQRVRDAERERIYNDFKDRLGEIITGVVRRFERGSNIIVDLGQGIEAILPSREQTPRESYRPGDRIVALLKKIDREARGPQIVLSRTDVGLLVKLFEMEVPEIYEGIVRIVAAGREPGARSKIAVSSRDSDVDPVGACVGMKGSRVQAVVQELRGEKIDIVPFDRDPARFVCNAIAPAEVVRVVIDESHATMELIVPDAKLSLAIGRRGQNVRLASQLTGWRLDIVSESRFRQLEDEAMRRLSRIDGEEGVAKDLYRMGFRALDEVVEASDEELLEIEGVGPDRLVWVRQRALDAAEEDRLERLTAARELAVMPTDRERLSWVAGVTERLIDLLEKAGYGSPEALLKESDADRLAARARVDAAKAAAMCAGAKRFVEQDWPPVAAEIAKHEAVAKEAAAKEAAAEAAAKEAAAEAAATEAAAEAAATEAAAEAAAPEEVAAAKEAAAEAAPEDVADDASGEQES